MQSSTCNAEAQDTQTIPSSSMLWVRNLKKYVGSGTGLGSEALMELETKRVLLEAFKERQQKNAQSGTLPTFYKKKPAEGSIGSKVQRLARFSFLKKQTEQLLNADDLDTMWVCLRENCVVDDSTGAEKLDAVGLILPKLRSVWRQPLECQFLERKERVDLILPVEEIEIARTPPKCEPRLRFKPTDHQKRPALIVDMNGVLMVTYVFKGKYSKPLDIEANNLMGSTLNLLILRPTTSTKSKDGTGVYLYSKKLCLLLLGLCTWRVCYHFLDIFTSSEHKNV